MIRFIGLLFGSIFFGPVGGILGFLLGWFFDSRLKLTTRAFFYKEFDADSLFQQSFPILAADITRAAGVQKNIVLAVKSLARQYFGTQKAVKIMASYKQFVELGYDNAELEEICENIFYYMGYQSKIFLLQTLFTILKAHNTFTPREVYAIQNISYKIGITGYEFDLLLRRFKYGDARQQSRQYNFNYATNSGISPYKVLGVDRSATVDEIKKQYRTLCKKHHPDVTNDKSDSQKEESAKKMREIIDAYEKIKKERNIK